MNGRITCLKNNIQKLNDMGVRKTYLYEYVGTSLRTNAEDPVQIRRAKAFAYLLEQVPVVVLPYELIAGSMIGLCPVWEMQLTKKMQREQAAAVIEKLLVKKKEDSSYDGAVKFGEGEVKSFEDDFTTKNSRWVLMSRVHHDASIDFKDLQKLITEMEEKYKDCKELEKYEIGRELERCFKIEFNPEDKKLYNELPWFVGNHLNLNYARILKDGLGCTKEQIESKLLCTEDKDKKEYYKAAAITIDAVIDFIKRYSKELRFQSHNDAETVERQSELEEMAKICARIATEPAANFYEAVQLTWMLHVIASIGGGSALSFGRIDQYLYPYYQNDAKSGKISYEEAKELLCCLWLKVNEPKMRTVQSLTLGGITPDGQDAVNELTQICLDVISTVRMPYPNVGLRINKKNPDWIIARAVDTIKSGSGQPMLLNDDVWIKNILALGYPEKVANDYYNMGCVEIMVPGKLPNWGVTEAIAFPILIDQVMAKVKEGIEITTFDEFLKIYFERLDLAIEQDYQEAMQKKVNMKDRCFDPYSSILIDDCLEKGLDVFQGGSEYPTHWSVYAYGIGTVADSLYAIKKFVFDEKKTTLKELENALQADFNGYERLHTMLEKGSPVYGNGIAEVDEVAEKVLTHFNESVFRLNHGIQQDKFVSTLFGYFFHIYHGEIAGATPNGRYKGEPFSDSMGPSQGKDVKGPTRMLNSVLHLNHDHITGGYALNLKLPFSIIKESSGMVATVNLIKAYIKHGGPQIQIYTTDDKEMKDAQIYPEKHRDLIVRVGGYCEFFVNLDISLQNEIIERTMHTC